MSSAPPLAGQTLVRPAVRRRLTLRHTLRRTARTALDQVLPWLSLAAGLVLWEAVGRSRVFSFVPSLGEVLAAFWSMVQTGKLDALGATLQALAIGYGLSVVLGIATGVAMARSRLIKYVLDPYINAFMTIPSSALIPVYLVLFGLGAETRVMVVFMHAYFVVVVNTIAGAQTTPADLLEMARAFGAGEAALVRKVVVPSALPLVLTGLRLGFGRAVRGIINGETILASVGIGQLLIRYGRTFQMDYLYGVVLTIVLLAVVGTTTIGIIERRTTRWQHA